MFCKLWVVSPIYRQPQTQHPRAFSGLRRPPFPKDRMSEPNPMPAFRLGCGTTVCGYRLLRRLGHGWEGTSYLAQEAFSGVVRRVKFYRSMDGQHADQVGHVAATYDRLAATGAVPVYHNMGVWRRGRQSIPFLAFDYIDGQPLSKMLMPGRWRRGWTDRKAVDVLAVLAGKLAAVQDTGLAIGDFPHGHNIMVTPDQDAVWCDITAGWLDEPFTDQAADAANFFTILDLLATHQPESPLIVTVCRRLARFRDRRRWRGGFARIAALLEPFTA